MTKESNVEPELVSKQTDTAVPGSGTQTGPRIHTTGRLPGQGAFTTFGCDLTTGEPLYEMAGMGQIHR